MDLGSWRRWADIGVSFVVVFLLWSLGTGAVVLALNMTCCPDAHGNILFRAVVSGLAAVLAPGKFFRT